jgi:hypothetical protein
MKTTDVYLNVLAPLLKIKRQLNVKNAMFLAPTVFLGNLMNVLLAPEAILETILNKTLQKKNSLVSKSLLKN